ncbi:hypothetical protein GLA29479_3542 [Lysobacter antibioticus]|uniref:DUF6216 family protein n=1 Tax=Lysobacter antibioticus TaxID=84531 RepID=UPI0007171B55|nr:DUF6216 family protein [Lysobacter antibioticus]ALN64395.1 hypothetical protein GLA29479_3542 [Lysobacter antibioticus]
MDLKSISSLFGDISFWVALLFATATIYVCFRSGSSHLMIYRLWRWFTDKQEISDPKVRAFMNEQNSLMSFRFVTGLPASSMTQAHRLIRSINVLGLDVADVRKAHDVIDIGDGNVAIRKIPSKAWQISMAIATGLLLLATTMAACGVFYNRAILQFKETHTWFLLNEEFARAPFDGSRSISLEDCQPTPTPELDHGFNVKELKTLCDGWRDPKTKTFIDRTVSEQRWSFGCLFLTLLLLVWHPYHSLRSGAAVQRLKRQLDKKPA